MEYNKFQQERTRHAPLIQKDTSIAPRKMILWTYQHNNFQETLEETGRVFADWKQVEPCWRPAYEWMVKQMSRMGIESHGYAPIWAWHSCSRWQAQPAEDDGLALLSQHQIECGVILVEFEAPPELVLLSWYIPWNRLLDDLIDHKNTLQDVRWNEMFMVLEDDCLVGDAVPDCIQAALPYFDAAWIREISTPDLAEG